MGSWTLVLTALVVLVIRGWASGWFEPAWQAALDWRSALDYRRLRDEKVRSEADRDLGEPL